MEEYDFVITLKIKVTAFDKDDAESVIRDFFGPGPMDDIVEIVDMSIK